MYCNCDQVDNLLTKAGGWLNIFYHGKYMSEDFRCVEAAITGVL